VKSTAYGTVLTALQTEKPKSGGERSPEYSVKVLASLIRHVL